MAKNPLTTKPVKLYRDCNPFGKLWRCRWYFAVPYWTVKEWKHEKKLSKVTDFHLPSSFRENWSLMVALAEYKMHKFVPFSLGE